MPPLISSKKAYPAEFATLITKSRCDLLKAMIDFIGTTAANAEQNDSNIGGQLFNGSEADDTASFTNSATDATGDPRPKAIREEYIIRLHLLKKAVIDQRMAAYSKNVDAFESATVASADQVTEAHARHTAFVNGFEAVFGEVEKRTNAAFQEYYVRIQALTDNKGTP